MDIRISGWAWLPTDDYPPQKLKRLKDMMTVYPQRTSQHQTDIAPILLYEEREGYIGIPREYLLPRRKLHHKIIDEMSRGRKVDVSFKGELKPDQAKAVDKVVRSVTGQVTGIGRAHV